MESLHRSVVAAADTDLVGSHRQALVGGIDGVDVWCMWSAKGGSGCSVIAASAAITSARREPVLLVDLAGGDLAAILGVDVGDIGLADWLGHTNPPPDALSRVEVRVLDGLHLLPFGSGLQGLSQGDSGPDADPAVRLSLLAHVLAADDRTVIVDLGCQADARRSITGGEVDVLAPFVQIAARSTLVTRLCYLGLRTALTLPVPDDAIAVVEPDRALRPSDVAGALGVPVATLRWDGAIARAVDAGLLTQRLPRPLQRLPLAGHSVEASPVAAGS